MPVVKQWSYISFELIQHHVFTYLIFFLSPQIYILILELKFLEALECTVKKWVKLRIFEVTVVAKYAPLFELVTDFLKQGSFQSGIHSEHILSTDSTFGIM